MHLVGFYYKNIYHEARSSECLKSSIDLYYFNMFRQRLQELPYTKF